MPPKKGPSYGNQYGGAMLDDANEDDFWYQTPKNPNAPGGQGNVSGEY